MPRVVHAVLAGGMLASFVLGGCNAVLGIDEAHLSETQGAASKFNGESKVATNLEATCSVPSKACADCLATTTDCNAPKGACLADQKCRVGLNAYRVCLGPSCSDEGDECRQGLTKLENGLFPGAPTYTACLELCPACTETPLVDPCELYCGCMVDQCGDVFGLSPDPFAECKAACLKEKPPDILCRFTHCQAVAGDLMGGHCAHALGNGNCATNASATPGCPDRSHDGFACDTNKDCCSNDCQRHVCQKTQ